MIDVIQKPTTIHTYTGGGTGSYSIDGDWNSAQSVVVPGHKGPTNINLSSQHEFSSAKTIEEVRWRVYTDARRANCQYGGNANNSWRVQYWDLNTSAWVTFPGGSGSGWSSNPQILTREDFGSIKTNKIQLYGSATANTNCSGGDSGQETSGEVSLYELQCWIKLQGHVYII